MYAPYKEIGLVFMLMQAYEVETEILVWYAKRRN